MDYRWLSENPGHGHHRPGHIATDAQNQVGLEPEDMVGRLNKGERQDGQGLEQGEGTALVGPVVARER